MWDRMLICPAQAEADGELYSDGLKVAGVTVAIDKMASMAQCFDGFV